MAFLLNTLSIPVRRVVFCGFVATVGCVAAAASEATAARPPRAERIATRRLERIDVLERRAEAAAEMPPRPADVRRLLRRGVPLSEIMPPVGRGRPAATAARATTPTPQAAAATTAQAQPARLPPLRPRRPRRQLPPSRRCDFPSSRRRRSMMAPAVCSCEKSRPRRHRRSCSRRRRRRTDSTRRSPFWPRFACRTPPGRKPAPQALLVSLPYVRSPSA
jgi:hypothetical protein